MSLADWDIYRTNAAMGAGISPITPILGSGTLELRTNGVGDVNRGINLLPSATLMHGFTRGVQRSLFRIDQFGNSFGNYDNRFGIVCMCSQGNLTAGAGSCYALWTRGALVSGVPTMTLLQLVKFTTGILGTPTVLAQANINLAAGTVVALELEWDVDLDEIGGVLLRGRMGSALDYSDLAQVVVATSTTAVLTSTVGEGPAMFAVGVAEFTLSVDQTESDPLD